RRHTRSDRDWSSDVCSSDLRADAVLAAVAIVVLMQVWRVHELFPILAVPGLPIVATLGAGLLFFLGRSSGRVLGGLDRPLVAARSEERRVGKEGSVGVVGYR